MPSDLQKILSMLSSLTTQELDLLSVHVKALRQLPSNNNVSNESIADDSVDDVVTVVCQTLESCGSGYISPSALKKGSVPAIREKITKLDKYLDKISKNRVLRQTFLSIAIRLLYEDLTKIGIPTSGRMLLSHLHRIPAIINTHFPGYAENDLLPMIVRIGK